MRVRPETEKIDLLIAKADGTDERILASRPYLDYFSGMAWSPDGKTIVFTTLEAEKRSMQCFGRYRSLTDRFAKCIRQQTSSDVRTGCQMEEVCWCRSLSGPEGTALVHLLSKRRAIRLTNDLMDYGLCCLDLTQDGKTVVDTEQTTVSDLWVAPAGNATKAKPITTKEPAIGRFSWMSNGNIVFANGDGNLVVVNPDGSGHTLLTPNERPNWAPSACGFIVYAAYREQKIGVWRMDSDGSNPIRIADETLANGPQCSPDGKWVVYLRSPSWTPLRVPITEGRHRRLQRTLWPPVITALSLGSFQYSVAISPDGKLIAYLTLPDSPVENPGSPSASRPNQLKVIPFDGGVPLYQFDWPPSASDPRWDHGGKAVEYVLTKNGVSNIWQQPLNRRTSQNRSRILSPD